MTKTLNFISGSAGTTTTKFPIFFQNGISKGLANEDGSLHEPVEPQVTEYIAGRTEAQLLEEYGGKHQANFE